MKKLKILLFLCVVACTLTVQAQKQFTLNSNVVNSLIINIYIIVHKYRIQVM